VRAQSYIREAVMSRPLPPPCTPESIQAALAARDAEREEAQRACGGRLVFHEDTGTALVAELQRIATAHPFPLTEQHQAQIDELFTAPSAIERVHVLQAHESLKRDELAEDIAA